MNKTLFDTTIVSDFLYAVAERLDVVPAVVFVRSYLQQYVRLDFSVVTRFEIRRGLMAKSMKDRLSAFNALCLVSNILPLDTCERAETLYQDVWGEAEELWASLKKDTKR